MSEYQVKCSESRFLTAITHPSIKVDFPLKEDYEQLETIGDAVLDLLVLEFILSKFPKASPSQLTQGRSNIVRNEVLGALGERIGLRNILHVHSSYQIVMKDLSNCLEAIYGAIFFDSGLKACRIFFNLTLDHLNAILERTGGGIDINAITSNPVGKLQEYAQMKKYNLPNYETIGKTGPDNNPVFSVQVSINVEDMILKEIGSGRSKKKAKERAARKLLKKLGV